MDRRQYLKAAAGVGVAGVGGYGLYASAVRGPTYESRDGRLLSGVAPTSREFEASLDPFETWLGQRHAVVGTFADLGVSEWLIERIAFSELEATWQRGQVPHLWLQPFVPDEDGETSPRINTEIAAGEHDDVVETWADALAEWALESEEPDRRMYLNLAPEMNGDWSPWSAALGDGEEEFVAMWRRVHDMVMDTGLGSDHVQWIWALDNENAGVDQRALYPGDEYVDWVAVHGYNWTGWHEWRAPWELYDRTIDVLRDVTDRPIAVTEFGCSSETEDGDHDPGRKAEWIADAYEYFREEDVRMALWFDIDKETDWAVFDGERGAGSAIVDGQEYDVYPAYREAIRADDVLGPHPDHPRVLTDEEFAGRF